MEINFKLTVKDGKVSCSAMVDGLDAFDNATANILTIGALEVARASLLAARWGVDIGPLKQEPIVKEDSDENA